MMGLTMEEGGGWCDGVDNGRGGGVMGLTMEEGGV